MKARPIIYYRHTAWVNGRDDLNNTMCLIQGYSVRVLLCAVVRTITGHPPYVCVFNKSEGCRLASDEIRSCSNPGEARTATRPDTNSFFADHSLSFVLCMTSRLWYSVHRTCPCHDTQTNERQSTDRYRHNEGGGREREREREEEKEKETWRAERDRLSAVNIRYNTRCNIDDRQQVSITECRLVIDDPL